MRDDCPCFAAVPDFPANGIGSSIVQGAKQRVGTDNHRRAGSGASRRAAPIRLGVYIPTSGVAGLWGPSCRALAELAVSELNEAGGISGRRIEMKLVDAGTTPEHVAAQASTQMLDNQIDAIVGMHTSDVRQALAGAIGGEIPYIYTPLYEGGAAHPGVFCIGETPEQQLLPGLDWLTDRYRLRRWYMIGNDYVWPRRTHALVRRRLTRSGVRVVGEDYLPFGTGDIDQAIQRLSDVSPDGVLVSLVGDDAVQFNRAFARAGLDRKAIRFSCAVEENMLMAMGAGATRGLFAAAGYFGQLQNASNNAFLERYHSRFGDRAPVVNSIGQSVYEGVYFLRALMGDDGDWRRPGRAIRPGATRQTEWRPSARALQPTYLAEAEGYDFRIVQAFSPYN